MVSSLTFQLQRRNIIWKYHDMQISYGNIMICKYHMEIVCQIHLYKRYLTNNFHIFQERSQKHTESKNTNQTSTGAHKTTNFIHF